MNVTGLDRLNRMPGRLPASETGGALVDIGHWAYSPHLPDNIPHRHAYYEICLVGRWGQGLYLVDGAARPLQSGTVFFSRPGVLHQIVNTAGQPGMELSWLTFHLQFPAEGEPENELTALLRRFASASRIQTFQDSSGSIGALWKALYTVASASAADSARQPQFHHLRLALFLALTSAGSGWEESSLAPAAELSGSETDLAQSAVRFIHNNPGRRLRVSEIADHLNVSVRHLTRLFARFTGVPPATYIENARLQRARTLLLRTDDPIKQISVQVGYEDVHHFTRAFSRHAGCPPAQFRKSQGAAGRPTPEGANIQNPGTLV